jgi:hypothetical protein
MRAPWKLAAEARLMNADTPAVLTTGMVNMLATATTEVPPSSPTIDRWLKDLVLSQKLRPVIKGVYLNLAGHRNVSPAAAAQWVRTRSIVSLAWVLEQAGLTNNFGDTVTCVIPIEAGWSTPQVSDRKTQAGTFRFFAMPAHLNDERAGRLADLQDQRFDYRRATPEKALLDWIYLGASPRSRMTRPPFDLEIEPLNAARLKRLAKGLNMAPLLESWREERARYQANPEVEDNASSWLKI